MERRDRDGLIRAWSRLGITEDDQRALLRNAATIDRLNEATCNGDWPCDNGERKTRECSECACHYAPSTLTAAGVCQDCRAQARVRAIVARYPSLALEFNGDPRGLPFRIESAPALKGGAA